MSATQQVQSAMFLRTFYVNKLNFTMQSYQKAGNHIYEFQLSTFEYFTKKNCTAQWLISAKSKISKMNGKLHQII